MSGKPQWSQKRVQEIVAAHAHLEGPLLPILHELQAEFGFIPRDTIPLVAHALNLTRAEVYGVVRFYHDFRDKPAGRHVVKLCRAEACQSMGGNALADATLKHFGIAWKETTADGAIVLRQAGVYPIEMYSNERVQEFLEADALPAALKRKVAKALKAH